jgi:uncharacterized protein (DUF608 family)
MSKMEPSNVPEPDRRFSGWDRRTFMKLSGASVMGLAFSTLPAMAGPFNREDFDRLVPADKKLTPEWVASLTARGEPQFYRGAELEKIGMPVGGICAGQLYLGGDGRLWHWDIFNVPSPPPHDDTHYRAPLKPRPRLAQGFTLRVNHNGNVETRRMQQGDWSEIRFRGEYPIGCVEYADPGAPVAVKLEAFSPFIPLNTDDSALPATILEFTLTNTTRHALEATLTGFLENVLGQNEADLAGVRHNHVISGDGFTFLECAVKNTAAKPTRAQPEPDLVFEDWNKKTYQGWEVEGTAFGAGPVRKADMPAYQGDVGGDTERVANSHASAPGSTIEGRDDAKGKLTSRPFTVERDYITFWIGGGNFPGHTCLNLKIGGKVVLTATGQADNRMTQRMFAVAPFRGQTAVIEIVDAQAGGWGHVGVGKIVFTDRELPRSLPDYGTMGLALLGLPAEERSSEQTATGEEQIVGELGRTFRLKPGHPVTVTFILTWHFPQLTLEKLGGVGRHYATRFDSARAVAGYVTKNYTRLAGETKRWRETWYDSTLPYWFLDRTFANTSTLATSTCLRFANGRFYGWEGVECCPGTCGHVYHYAHAIARLFPELERSTREKIDFGLAQQPNGAIDFRAEFNDFPAVDGQAGTILRALREHQMTTDNSFLRRNWKAIRRATEWLIAQDGNGDGLIEGHQHNTLDTDWFGPVAWLSGLYVAALAAAARMAEVAGDAEFAQTCQRIFDVGRKNLVERLFDGEYFINLVDPRHLDAINSGTGCEIDQVFGQSWAFQVGLPRVFPERETKSALKALWRYNFTPDAGHYRKTYEAGRWYAMAGEACLLMCSFPRRGWDFAQAQGRGPGFAAGYFNECFNGCEHQAAGHMLWEGLVLEGMAVERAVHDRYHASRRNPWNEIECSDHYARSMASYGVFLGACGYEYDGPAQHIGFAPKLTPENFRCAFTSAEGWGSYSQQIRENALVAEITVKWGQLNVKSVAMEMSAAKSARVSIGNETRHADLTTVGNRALIKLNAPVQLKAGETLRVTLV